ncbi:MAG: GntR family transcriptional regulator [Sagittula sp.]|jgi:DNA-binding GntR family transcriptional regulator|uniref:GntR family transcriptional regulator n=1 Tax=unclassified Sagittula TaxID=2624628 RepID=UPI000C2D68E5|nr:MULTISPECIES: GntR family transcriptional regulator [unclassified Sagittula]AUC52071.1 GntR family transcriptional regulator [Sagittula sp. P11]WHZ36730.1 GntR family transcriptional regulator [Sagittula sp. MA-2]
MAEETLPEQIANRLRRDILRGVLPPGTAVKERDHAGELGVSRTPMREAIRILAKEGLVILRPARSPIVAQPSFEDVAHNIEVMTALELLSARLACERASDAEIDHISDVAARMAREYDKLDKLEVFEIDMSFHRAIAEAAGNPVLAEMHRALLARLWRARYLSASRKHARDRVLDQHAAIVQGLRARDVAEVEKSLRAHLDHLLINVADFFDSEQTGTTDPASAATSG